MRLGVIGGTSLNRFADAAEAIDVTTPYGDVTLHRAVHDGAEWFFLSRHGSGHARPPHRVPHRANVWALAAANVDRAFAVASVGSLRADLGPGTFVVPDDYLDLNGHHPERTFHDEAPVHVEVTQAYCPEVRGALVKGARAAGAHVHDGGVYAATPGPRFETRAEVQRLARDAHVVGMTGCPEAALAREAGLCYANLSVVANLAAGVGDRVYATADIVAFARGTEGRVREALVQALKALPDTRACRCRAALDGARIPSPPS